MGKETEAWTKKIVFQMTQRNLPSYIRNKDNTVNLLRWPTQNSDVSATENLWAQLMKSVWAGQPATLNQAHQYCHQE